MITSAGFKLLGILRTKCAFRDELLGDAKLPRPFSVSAAGLEQLEKGCVASAVGVGGVLFLKPTKSK